MPSDVDRYIDEYVRLLKGIEVTTGDGESLDYQEGVDRSIALFGECRRENRKQSYR